MMDERTFEILETRLRNSASHLPYPATPDISRAEAVRRAARRGGRPRLQWRVAWVAASILGIILLAALATPTVRAAVLEFIQIGVVRIFQTAPSPMPGPPVTATPLPAGTETSSPAPTHAETPGLGYSPEPTRTETTGLGYSPEPTAVAGIVDPGRPTPADLVSILDLEGQTTLEEARAKLSFPIRLPSYPPGLGPPDQVILQDHDGSVLILVWTQPKHPDKARLSLHIIEPGSWTVEKLKPVLIQETTVNGQAALWTAGPYIVRLLNGDIDFRRMIEGNVLIWTEGGFTYRLETDLPLGEALRIAESVK